MKKNNVSLIICLIIGVVFITVLTIIKLNDESQKPSQEGFTKEELKAMDYVDKKLESLTKSDSYKNLSLDSKVIEVEKILKELKKDKYIDNYNYDENNYLFSFQYKGGALGGVMLKEFDPMLN